MIVKYEELNSGKKELFSCPVSGRFTSFHFLQSLKTIFKLGASLKSSKLHLTVVAVIVALALSSCGKKPSATGVYLAEKFKEKSYRKFDTAAYNKVVAAELLHQKKMLVNYKLLSRYFEKKKLNDTAWVISLLENRKVDTLEFFLRKAAQHGISPDIFFVNKIDSLKKRLYKGKYDSLPQLYATLARLQVLSANAMISYASKIQFGCVDPAKIYSRYLIPVQRPTDSALLVTLDGNWADVLHKIQPKRKEYLALQKALDTCKNPSLKRKILVNMERYRWKVPADTDRFVFVNIPAFDLRVVDSGKTKLTMIVCVGEKREADYATKRANYLKSGNVEDKPKNHETPIMYGKINNIQLNPKWNIPHSIVQTEILAKSRANPNYLNRSSIKVYDKKGKVIDPFDIDWDSLSPGNIPYSFKQDPGDGNALGKFKFNFPNSSSIYLHDTPNKSAFKKDNRAVSHGCVRVADPLKLAEELVQNPRIYDNVRIETGYPPLDSLKMLRFEKKQQEQSENGHQTHWINLDNKWPLFIDYYTCMPSENGSLRVYNDVYEYDSVLLDSLKRFLVKGK